MKPAKGSAPVAVAGERTRAAEGISILRSAGDNPILRCFPKGAIIVFDADLRYVCAGGLGLADVGLSRELLEGKTIFEVFPPSFVDVIEPLYRQALAGHESVTDVLYSDRVYTQHLGPLRDDDGAVIAGMGFTQDVTETRRAERELRQSEEHFRLTFQYSPIALALVGLDGRYLQANPAMCELTGYTERQLVDRTVADLTHPDDMAADTAAMAAALAGKRSTYTVDKRFLTSAATVVWGVKSATLVRSEDGSPLHFICQILNINAAKEHEQVLAEERRRLREAESLGRVGSWELNTLTQQVVWSAGMFQIWGIDPDTFGGDYAAGARQQIHPEDVAIVDTAVAACVETGQPIRIRYRVTRADDGAVRWVDVRGEPIYQDGQLVRIGGVVADVTDEVAAEAEALAAHSFQQAVISASPDIIAVWDLASWSIVWANRSITDLLGYDAQDVADMAGDLPGHLVVAEDKAALYAAVEATRQGSDDEVIPADFRMLHKDGTRRWFSRRAAPLRRDEHGHVTQIVTVTRDTTEEKSVQAALRESEAVFHQLAQSVDVAFLLRSVDPPEYIYVSPRFQEMFGHNPMTIQEAPADTLRRIHPDDLERFLRDYWVPSQAGVPATCEYRIMSSDGAEHWVRAKSAPVASADGKMRRSASTVEDITARRKAEAALRSAQEAEKTAMVAARDAALAATEMQSNFAASAAHELRTPTAAVLGFVEEVLDNDALAEDDRKFLDIAYRNALRLSALIDDLLIVGEADIGSARMSVTPTPLIALVESVVSSFSAVAQRADVVLSSDFAADRDSGEDPLCAMVDPIRLEQALTNLVGNAVKFTPAGGQVEVSLRAVDDKVQISVQDTGMGIDADALDHIFDRFYRTKEAVNVGIKGTGLGLAIAQQMIEAQGGQLTVTSVVGEGSTFTMTLPAANQPLLDSP